MIRGQQKSKENIELLLINLEKCRNVYIDLDKIYSRVEANNSEQLRNSPQIFKRDSLGKLEGINYEETSFCDLVQPNANSSIMHKMKKKAARYRNASNIATEMVEHSGGLPQILEECVDATKFLDGKIRDEYRASFDVPKQGDVILDFNGGNGPERKLKKQVLKGRGITSAAGQPSQSGSISGASGGEATGVEGMGGIGKTVALKGLVNNPDIKKEFKDGIYFMTFGSVADESKAIYQVQKIVKQSRGKMKSKDMPWPITLEEAVSKAVEWFKGRIVLFVCDDLWPTEEKRHRFLTELKKWTEASKLCHLVFATRSQELSEVEQVKENIVTFNCLEVTGNIAHEIFLKDAGISDDKYKELSVRISDTIEEKLENFGGHCLAFAVAGQGIRKKI